MLTGLAIAHKGSKEAVKSAVEGLPTWLVTILLLVAGGYMLAITTVLPQPAFNSDVMWTDLQNASFIRSQDICT